MINNLARLFSLRNRSSPGKLFSKPVLRLLQTQFKATWGLLKVSMEGKNMTSNIDFASESITEFQDYFGP